MIPIRRLGRRTLPGLAAAVLAAALALPARADHAAPFLDDLEAGLAALEAAPIDPESSPRRYELQQRALDRALAALARPSSTLAEDLGLLSQAAAPLERVFEPGTAADDLLERALMQYTGSMNARKHRLGRASRDLVPLQAYMLGKEAVGRAYHFLGKAGGEGVSRARSARFLQKGARFLVVAGARLGLGGEYDFVEGTLTATIDGTPRTWRIATAVREQHPTPTDGPIYDQFTLVAYAGETDVRLTLLADFLAPGPDGPEGGMLLTLAPIFPALPFSDATVEYSPASGDPANLLVLTARDEAAGTAAGTFRFTMHPTGGTQDILVEGEFAITAGYFGIGL